MNRSLVMKFGGSCISSKENLDSLISVVASNLNKKPVIVVSALIGVTKTLKDMAYSLRYDIKDDDSLKSRSNRKEKAKDYYQRIYDIHKSLSDSLVIDFEDYNILRLNHDFYESLTDTDKYFERFRDQILSIGERYAARLVAMYLSKNGIRAFGYDSFDLGIVTDSNYGNATYKRVSFDNIKKSMQELDRKNLPVITGFIGKEDKPFKTKNSANYADDKDVLTTMGPNSSDDTAVIFGVALNVNEICVYKNSKGILAAHPELVDDPKTIPELNYIEAAELASYGCDVMTPTSIALASIKKKPIKVISLNYPEIFTLISEKSQNSFGPIKGIASKNQNSIITVESPNMVGKHGYAANIYGRIADYRISLDVLASSGMRVSSTIDPFTNDRKRMDNETNFSKLERSLHEFGDTYLAQDKVIISLVGTGLLENSTKILSRASRTLDKKNIKILMSSLAQGSLNYIIVINQEDEIPAIKALYKEFIS